MNKNTITILVILVLACLPSSVFSQSFGTGDSQLEVTLGNMNVEAGTNLTVFKSDLAVSFSVPVVQFEFLFTREKMTPAEVYLALEISKTTHKPVTVIAASYRKNRHRGWGYIANEMGIKPGSAHFKNMRDHSRNHLDRYKKKHGDKGKHR
jgi:hypothetical protein